LPDYTASHSRRPSLVRHRKNLNSCTYIWPRKLKLLARQKDIRVWTQDFCHYIAVLPGIESWPKTAHFSSVSFLASPQCSFNLTKYSYMLLSRHRNAGQNRNIKITNRTFENMAQFRYLGTTARNQNLIQEEIKRRLNSGNACCHSVQKLLSSCLLSKTLKIKMYKTIILSLVLYGCETWYLTLGNID
jgi:hypothetical protein